MQGKAVPFIFLTIIACVALFFAAKQMGLFVDKDVVDSSIIKAEIKTEQSSVTNQPVEIPLPDDSVQMNLPQDESVSIEVSREQVMSGDSLREFDCYADVELSNYVASVIQTNELETPFFSTLEIKQITAVLDKYKDLTVSAQLQHVLQACVKGSILQERY
ncbi:MAG: hypothetical protein ACRBHB_10350 [Arenicella sp.]